MMVKPEDLDAMVEFDSPFTIDESGNLTDSAEYAPSSYDGELDGNGWEYWSHGYSGQYAYRGPIMHPSEFLGGGMARDLLAEPGTYCVIADEHLHSEDCDCEETEGQDDAMPNGWAVVKRSE